MTLDYLLRGRDRRGASGGGGGGGPAAVLDNFTGVDGTNVAERLSDSGHQPVEIEGVTVLNSGQMRAEIQGNRMKNSAGMGQNCHIIYASGRSDGRVRAKYAVVTGSVARMAMRATDGNNKLAIDIWPGGSQYYLYRFEGASVTVLSTENTAPVNGDEFEAILNGASVSVTRNDVDEGVAATEVFNQTAENHGVNINDVTGEIEWFSVNAL